MRRMMVVGWFVLAGCGVDMQSGQQLAGQSCFVPSDCATGLTCFERRCLPIGGTGAATNQNNQNNANNQNNQNNQNNVTDSGIPDAGSDAGLCQPGERRCSGFDTVLVCVDGPDGPTIVREICVDGWQCQMGECFDVQNCVDNDNDGYGLGCDRGPDCDDRRTEVNPGVRENCNTPFDDNCNGAVNENCNPDACCAGGCQDGTFCNTDCFCEMFEPDICRAQNQPCFDLESFVNGYYCVDLTGTGVGRCYGVCNQGVPNPDATCPDPNSSCGLGGDGDQALCASDCSLAAGCGDPTLGCLPLGSSQSEGSCLPANPNNQLGDTCDPDVFLDCAAGLVCVASPNGQNGRCREACRPFLGNAQSDCGHGHCFSYSATFGVCLPDNNSTEGEQCGPQFSMCNEDVVACFPSGFGGNRCQRLCRLGSDVDCEGGLTCLDVGGEDGEIGVCAPMF